MCDGDGYLYCFSNPSMPGILKIGMTERTPDARLIEANSSDTWRPPTPYIIEFAKKVSNPSQKEKTIHTLLEQYTIRIHPRREFFRVTTQEVSVFFDLMDGEIWSETRRLEEELEEEVEEETADIFSKLDSHIKTNNVKGCRDMSKCFTNGQRIRHRIGINKSWVGVYDSTKNGIIYDGKLLTLNKFAVSHFESERPDRVSNVNAWKECECEIDGKWVSTYNL